ncbi:dihydropteroate synthase [Candidatus Lokiarchaeum ossiferum]|uniref:dihydropteroate synthase n=1 Tax=Candidatus Lokiarchaeum ossiferum TaxID=2951803 RepID=UPI00352F869A
MGSIHQELFEGYSIGDFSPVRIMGIVNLSPESFYQGSFIPNESLQTTIEKFIKYGATILDFGARSTAPWSDPISLDEELDRMQKTLTMIPELVPKDIILSIDTQYSKVARWSLEFGKKHGYRVMLNDISSFQTDPKMLDLVVSYNCPVCLMATFKKPGDAKTPQEILKALHQSILELKKRNYDTQKVMVDPGIGKWVTEKTYEYDLAMLDHLHDFRAFQVPILVGLSRKSFIGSILEEKDASKRDIGSLAATSIAIYNGAHIIRTHDVDEKMQHTIKVASAIRRKPIQIQNNNQICEIEEQIWDKYATEIYLSELGVTLPGAKIMSRKMISKNIILKNITAPQGLILKQELLARGGDVALHREVVTTENQKYDEKFTAVLIGTLLQMEKLVKKLRGQDLELDKLGKMIEAALHKEEQIKEIYSTIYLLIK